MYQYDLSDNSNCYISKAGNPRGLLILPDSSRIFLIWIWQNYENLLSVDLNFQNTS